MRADKLSKTDLLKMKKEIWEQAVKTQMHFNEMSVKSRQLGLSFVVAALGVSVVMLTRSESTSLLELHFVGWTLKTHVSALIVLVAAAGLYAVMRLDLGVYHRMLRGAVAFGEDLERSGLRYGVMQTPHGMTELISMFSRHHEVTTKTNGDDRTYIGKDKITAESKIRKFYIYTIFSLLVISAILFMMFSSIS